MKFVIVAFTVLGILIIPSAQDAVNYPETVQAPQQVKKIEPVKTKPKPKKPVQTALKEPEPVTATYAVGCELYRPIVEKYSWDVDTMMRIMSAESGCDPNNHNFQDNHHTCLGSFGLFQVGCVHGYGVDYLSDPINNIATAYNIWSGQGYGAWSTY